ncbi:MAG: outer membrane beta-barrel protein [Bacteroidetes bacterium]|nr:outer membrane beta-barrel protein [Bacteroidota bacterium]
MKRILFILITIFSLQIVKGQNENLRFGFTASPGLTWWKPDNTAHESGGARFALNYGVLIDYKFGNNSRYALSTGLLLTLDGGKLVGTGTQFDTITHNVVTTMTTKTQHLQIPMALKLRSNEVGYITYYGSLGIIPAFTIRRRADLKKSIDDVVVINEENIDAKNLDFYPNKIKNINPFDLGLSFEAGLEYSMTENTALVGGLFFTNGFINQLDDDDKERVATRNFGIRIGVLF